MVNETIVSYKSYRFGADRKLDRQQLEQFTAFFEAEKGKSHEVLGGRGAVTFCTIEGTGPVVIKYYRRGGLIGRFVKERYFRWGKPRSRREYEMLKRVKKQGVRVPEPVLYAWSGFPFYRCWLVTKEVENHRSLAQISRKDINRAGILLEKLADQLKILIKNRIHHVDFHPGNILVDSDDRIYIIDFDKAGHFAKNSKKLAEKYLARWKRAVIKYDLPAMLHEGLAKKMTPNIK